MCERAIELRPFIDAWLDNEIDRNPRQVAPDRATSDADARDLKRLRLSRAEWSHLKTITTTLSEFKRATEHLSQTKAPQVQNIWHMYNALFDLLERMTDGWDIEGEQEEKWPKIVRDAVERGSAKLSKYYSRTADSRGYLFNCAAILDPTSKLTTYEASFITDPYHGP